MKGMTLKSLVFGKKGLPSAFERGVIEIVEVFEAEDIVIAFFEG